MHDHSPDHTPSAFTRLEETRVMLESHLGMYSLLQAYQLVQVATLMRYSVSKDTLQHHEVFFVQPPTTHL